MALPDHTGEGVGAVFACRYDVLSHDLEWEAKGKDLGRSKEQGARGKSH